jgi:hypothetical protein
MARQRKQFLLRIPHELYDVYEAWAADELRSVNAQLEAVLTDAARRAGRRPRVDGTDPGPATDSGATASGATASGATAPAEPDGAAGGP